MKKLLFILVLFTSCNIMQLPSNEFVSHYHKHGKTILKQDSEIYLSDTLIVINGNKFHVYKSVHSPKRILFNCEEDVYFIFKDYNLSETTDQYDLVCEILNLNKK